MGHFETGTRPVGGQTGRESRRGTLFARWLAECARSMSKTCLTFEPCIYFMTGSFSPECTQQNNREESFFTPIFCLLVPP